MTLPQQEDPMQQASALTERRKHNNPHAQQGVRDRGGHAAADGCLVCAPHSIERRVAAVTPGESKDPMPRFDEGRFSGFHEWHNALAEWTLRQLQKIGDKTGFLATAFDCVEWAARKFYKQSPWRSEIRAGMYGWEGVDCPRCGKPIRLCTGGGGKGRSHPILLTHIENQSAQCPSAPELAIEIHDPDCPCYGDYTAGGERVIHDKSCSNCQCSGRGGRDAARNSSGK